MISYQQALDLVIQETAFLAHESLPPLEALGRVLAQDIVADKALPPFDNTAMDGFALRAADTAAAPITLPIVGSVAAGDVPDTPEQAGAIEIMTGAPMPLWCDTVVPVENVAATRGADGAPTAIALDAVLPVGQHIRRAGQDVEIGQKLVDMGQVITPEIIAVMASLGMGKVLVSARPKIALIGTGQEVVRDPDTALAPGQIYDSNTPYLRTALQREGMAAAIMPGSPDDVAGFLAAVTQAKDAQIIISTGAVSMGRRDFVPEALAQLGARTVFHKTAIRPGKPILFAKLPNGTYFFGLPGNPVSAAVGLTFFVLPLLRRLTGQTVAPRQTGILAADFNKKAGLTMFAKARKTDDRIEVLGGQQSFRIAPLLLANGWAVLPADTDRVKAGEEVEFVSFNREGNGQCR